jgi:hypothetical protein
MLALIAIAVLGVSVRPESLLRWQGRRSQQQLPQRQAQTQTATQTWQSAQNLLQTADAVYHPECLPDLLAITGSVGENYRHGAFDPQVDDHAKES